MKLLWRIVVPVACVALTGGAAVGWHFLEARATQRKLVEGAKACRVRAERGEENAQYDLARRYYQGKGVKVLALASCSSNLPLVIFFKERGE